MVVCASCQRQFQTIQACQQHARDKGHVYEVPTVTVVQSAPQTASSNGVSDNQTNTAQQLEGRVHCSICVVNVESESALKTHYREANVHPNCPCCPEGFRDQTALDVASCPSLNLSFWLNHPLVYRWGVSISKPLIMYPRLVPPLRLSSLFRFVIPALFVPRFLRQASSLTALVCSMLRPSLYSCVSIFSAYDIRPFCCAMLPL